MSTRCPAEFIAFAEALVDATGPILRRHFRGRLAVEDKADRSPVTVADREVEETLRTLIGDRFPGHGIVGEELGPTRPGASHVWVLDPIDGTAGFVTGKPLFGTLVGLLHEGRPVLGVIDHPALGERWIGAAGRATTHNGRPVRVRPCEALDRAMLYATSPQMFRGDDAAAFERLRARVRRANFGADCYAYALLASGFVDLVVEATMKPYDYLALVPVVEGAGGVITDWDGRALGLESDGRVVAAGDARMHEAARACLKNDKAAAHNA